MNTLVKKTVPKFQRKSVASRQWSMPLALCCLTAAAAFSASTSAQGGATEIQEVVVHGARKSAQSTIDLRRSSDTIVDGLSADEIGDIPALSIGEALENITGAASHRENGGASEISVRGLGPFLGTTVINGREVTNGGGNRAVNFSIFPSELFNKVAIHKTQTASYVEGAVSGQIQLDTLKPIAYGKQRTQLSIKGSAHPDGQHIADQEKVGYRATGSYINSWDTDYGTFGFSIGGQQREDSNPEAEGVTTTGSGRFEACQLDSFSSDAQPIQSNNNNRCEDGAINGGISNRDLQATIDANPDFNSAADVPYAYLARDRRFRRNTTSDDRQAVFTSLQWANDTVDVTFDYQFSERDQKELRQDLQFSNTQEDIRDLVSNPRTGVVDSFSASTEIRANTTQFQRLEEYEGFGLNVIWQVNDALELAFDVASNETIRTETDIEINLGATDSLDAIGANATDFRVGFDLNAAGTEGLGLATINGLDAGGGVVNPITSFNINDPRFFNAANRAQLRARQLSRENKIEAYRMDLSWDTDDLGFIHNIKSGVRFSGLDYDTFGGNRDMNGINEFDDENLAATDAESDAIVAQAANNCGQSGFPEQDFLSESRGGNNLFTFESGFGTGNSFATFDHGCLGNTLLQNLGGLAGLEFQKGRDLSSIDVSEDTFAFYLQANYETEFADYPIRGNFGVRIFETEVTSRSFRQPLAVTTSIDPMDGSTEFEVNVVGDPQAVSESNTFTQVLPSATLIVDIADDVVLRTGVFKGISRADPNMHANNRTVSNEGDEEVSREAALSGITGGGNPQLEPIESWNIDVGVDWYANESTLLAANLYWKEFQGSFETVLQTEEFDVDGNAANLLVNTVQVSDDTSELTGLELTVVHAFDYLPDYLPEFFGGFGVKLSYNYADSNFEFEDGFGGDAVAFDSNGNAVQQVGILPAAGLFGLSRHVSSSQLYWENDLVTLQAIWKTRSRYFQQFTRDTAARIRYIDDNEVLDLRAKYKVTDNVSLSLDVLNALGEVRQDYRGVVGNTVNTLEYGPRIFLGLRAKF